MSKRKYLVTGGTGFIGSALVRRLVGNGHSVRVLDNDLRGRASRLLDLSHQLELIHADVRDAKAVQEACRGVDSICHLASVNGTELFYSRPELVLDIAVKGMVNVLEGGIKGNVNELVLLSSSEVYQTPPKVPTDETVPLSVPDPMNPRYSYGGGKIISELMAINYGRRHFQRVMIVRPHNVFGPDMGREHVIPQFTLRMKEIADRNQSREIPFPIQGSGHETRAFIFIEDFIEGLMLVLNRGEHLGIYHIGTMEEVPVTLLARKIGEVFGRKIHVVPGAPAKGSTLRRCPDISRIQQLGFSPRVSLDAGLKTTVQWYLDNIHLRHEPFSGESR